jgi:putative ABC transport system permease protein
MTLLVVAGGVAGLLIVGGFFSYLFWDLREVTIADGLGHLQIFNSDHFRKDELHVLENGLADYSNIAAIAAAAPHVRGVAPRIDFEGLISNGSKSTVFTGTGVDPAKEKPLQFKSELSSGQDLGEESQGARQALLGAGLAHSLHAKIGDSLTLLAITADGALNGIDVEVSGIVTTGFKEVDDALLRVTVASAQQLLQSEHVTNLIVGLDATDNTDQVYEALLAGLKDSGSDLTLKKWSDLATYYQQVRLMFGGIFAFLGLIVFILVVLSSANTLLMSMLERTREIGTMLAMGTPRSWLVSLFLLEAIIIGAIGAATGVLLGTLCAFGINHSGIELSPFPGETTSMPLRILHEPVLMTAAASLMIISLFIASIVPAVRGSRLRIVEALAHV